jgi:phosphohistidine phosphatase
MKKSTKNESTRRKLIFVRHSKAEDQSPDIPDFERSLTLRGKVNTRMMAVLLRQKGEDPGQIVTSPAFRALETALIFGTEYGISPAGMRLAPELYLDLTEDQFLPFIRSLSDDDETVTFFGHNPLISEMAAYFASDEPEVLPKSGVCCLEFIAPEWKDVEPGSGMTACFLTPKDNS